MSEITREQRLWGRVLAIAMLIASIGVLIIALSVAGVLGYTPQPVSDPVEPDPWVSGNVTKDSHESSWSLVQYEDDYGDVQTLPGFTADTAHLNYSGIDGHQNYDISGANWSDPNDWTIGSCDMSNPTIKATEHGVSFYADPTAQPQHCFFDLNIQLFGVTDNTKYVLGAYFEDIGGYRQYTWMVVRDSNTKTKDYGAWSGCDDVPGEVGQGLYVANKNRTTIFESQTINKIGTTDLEFEDVKDIYVYFSAFGDTDPMKVEIFFLDFTTSIYQVGRSPTGNSVYRQMQSDNGSVELGTFSPNFDYSEISNMRTSYKQRASDLPEEYVEVSRTQSLSTYRFSYPQPDAIALHYDDVVLRDKLNQAGNAFSEVKLNGQDISYRYAPLSEGDQIVLLEGILEGEQPAVYFETSYSSDEWDGITQGNGGGWWDFGGGFITPEMVAPFVALGILVAILAVVLIQKFKKSREERPAGDEESDRGVEVEVRVR